LEEESKRAILLRSTFFSFSSLVRIPRPSLGMRVRKTGHGTCCALSLVATTTDGTGNERKKKEKENFAQHYGALWRGEKKEGIDICAHQTRGSDYQDRETRPSADSDREPDQNRRCAHARSWPLRL
jgi:hypothetical protein